MAAKDFSTTDLPTGTPEGSGEGMREDLSQDNAFQNFLDPSPEPVAQEEEETTTEANADENSSEEASSEEAVQDTEESITPSSQETPTVEAEEGTEEESGDERDATIEQLRTQLLEVTRVLAEQQMTKESESKEPAPIELDPVDFINDDETFQEALSDPKVLNKLLNETVQKAVNEAHQRTLKVLPEAIAPQLKESVKATHRVTNFFDSNPELKPHMEYVSFMMGKLLDNPAFKDKSDSEMDAVLANQCRTSLGLMKGKKKSRQKSQAPFANAGGTRMSQPKKSSMQSDVDSLMGY